MLLFQVEALSESLKPRMKGQDAGGLTSFKVTLERALDPVGGCKDGTILRYEFQCLFLLLTWK